MIENSCWATLDAQKTPGLNLQALLPRWGSWLWNLNYDLWLAHVCWYPPCLPLGSPPQALPHRSAVTVGLDVPKPTVVIPLGS